MDPYLKELDERLKTITAKFAEEIGAVRSGRPSVDMVGNLQVNYFEQMVPINQLGTLAVVPPREIRITVWDKNAVTGVSKAIEDAKAGFSVAAEGTIVHANLPALSNERREELSRLVKKITEKFRIEVRTAREETIKKLKAAEDKKTLTEDDLESGKEAVQKRVNTANDSLEAELNKKIAELSE